MLSVGAAGLAQPAGAVPPASQALPPPPKRVAVLNFGPPDEWKDQIGSVVGVQVWAGPWRQAAALLAKDNVDVVVIHVNCQGGGLMSEVPKFHEAFEKCFVPRFRTVAWIESGVHAAAMSIWPIEEFYFLPEGTLGACVAWRGERKAIGGEELQDLIRLMERASRAGRHDPAIMRSMQVMEPLSADIDARGRVTWFQALKGHYIVNGPEQILTLNSRDAMRFRVARGVVAVREDLAKALGIAEVQWAGKEASDLIDESMRRADRADKRLYEIEVAFQLALAAASSLGDKASRDQEIAVARERLAEMRAIAADVPHVATAHGLTEARLKAQEEHLNRLAER